MGDAVETFPILCEPCLGTNPFVRMVTEERGKLCRICDRPFAHYRWKPSATTRYRSTELCRTCAHLRNVCQCCLLDLEFGVSAEARDAVLDEDDRFVLPSSEVNKKWLAERHESALEEKRQDSTLKTPQYHKVDRAKLKAKLESKKEEQRKRVCGFFLRGHCSEASSCMWSHEIPGKSVQLSHQNRDCLIKTYRPQPPSSTCKRLLLLHVQDSINEDTLRARVAHAAAIESFDLDLDTETARVEFRTRHGAEVALAELWGNLVVDDYQIVVTWDKNAAAGADLHSSMTRVSDVSMNQFITKPPILVQKQVKRLPPGIRVAKEDVSFPSILKPRKKLKIIAGDN